MAAIFGRKALSGVSTCSTGKGEAREVVETARDVVDGLRDVAVDGRADLVVEVLAGILTIRNVCHARVELCV